MPRVPRLLSGPNVKSLNLSPPEAYLLSRVDDLLDENDLALVTGMTPAQVGATLDHLAKLGAIEIADPAASTRAPVPVGSSPGAAAPPRTTHHLDFDGPAPYDPAELNEPVELEHERKRRVLDVFYRLDDLTYYELLGVPGDADKKQIKTAYYAVAPDFHPDKYFRKQLGSFKAKIEAVFARITLAHDVLTAPKSRTEYDEYLEQTHKNRTTSAMLDQSAQDVAEILAAVEKAAAQAVAAAAPAPRAAGLAPGPLPPVSALSPQEALKQRREALARKLTGGGRKPGQAAAGPQAPAAAPAPAEMDPVFAERAAEALRLRHEAAVAEAKHSQAVRYMEAGRSALASKDFAAAANSYRIAASLLPDDVAVQAACAEALQTVAAALADGYWKQALYEEGQERWGEAALSYSKVCNGQPNNAQAHERVAFATLKSSGNSRRAVEFARKAIELDPRRAELRVTLARAYGAAGLEKSAFSELDRALELAPKDHKVLGLVSAARAAITTGKEGAPPPEKKRGFSGFVAAVRSAIAPKDAK